jgi:hypothetical protein
VAPLTVAYLAWAAAYVAIVWGLAAASFLRKTCDRFDRP